MMEDVLKFVPVGEANAQSAREIWKRVDCWAEITIQRRLSDLLSAGRLKRRVMPIKHGFAYLYWQEVA